MRAGWRRNSFALSLGLVLLAVATAKYRHGFFRTDGTDAAIPYCGARACWPDQNRSTGRIFKASIVRRQATTRTFKPTGCRSTPPITLVILSPLAGLSWDRYLDAWMLGALILLALTLYGIIRLADLRWNDPRVILLILFFLVFAPMRCAFQLGQNTLPAVALSVMSILALRNGRETLAGCLLGLAICFKPQDAMLLPVYFVLLRRWRTVGWSIATVATIAIVAIARVPLPQLELFSPMDPLAWPRGRSPREY